MRKLIYSITAIGLSAFSYNAFAVLQQINANVVNASTDMCVRVITMAQQYNLKPKESLDVKASTYIGFAYSNFDSANGCSSESTSGGNIVSRAEPSGMSLVTVGNYNSKTIITGTINHRPYKVINGRYSTEVEGTEAAVTAIIGNLS